MIKSNAKGFSGSIVIPRTKAGTYPGLWTTIAPGNGSIGSTCASAICGGNTNPNVKKDTRVLAIQRWMKQNLLGVVE
jgi:hypothetical protein